MTADAPADSGPRLLSVAELDPPMGAEAAERDRFFDGPVHSAFDLSYAAYWVVPRAVLQAMPVAWQTKFVKLMDELPETPGYTVLRKDAAGKFMKDPLSNYRRGTFLYDDKGRIVGVR